jgi:AcrR family transcriptional regulator
MPRLKAPQRREQLIDVATKIFAKWGYDAATTAAIAEAAGVTEPILYRHFRTKHELFIAIVREMSDFTLQHWRTLIENCDTATDKIRTIAKEFPRHINQTEDAYHVLHGALATSRDRKVLSVLKEHYTEIERFFREIIVEGQHAGEFRKDLDPVVPVWQLINTGIGFTMIALNLHQFSHVSVEDAVEFILRGLKN